MKNKKIILDIIMFVLMILLMNLLFTGIVLHEIIGLLVFILFIVHKYLNFRWIKTITKSIFSGNTLNSKIKLRYIIDLLLFIDVTLIIISGMIISQVIFVGISNPTIIWSDLHHLFAALGLIIIIIHTLLHYMEMKAIFKKKLEENKDNKLKNSLYYLIFLIIVILPISVMASKKFIDYLITPFKNENKSNNSTNSNNSSNSNVVVPTLEEYLSNLHCNGCSRHCFLNAIRCTRGKAYVEEATNNYNIKYDISYNINGDIEIDGYTITLN